MKAPAKLPELVTESYMIPSGAAGIELYVRNKRPVGMTDVPADKILLYVHGAIYPSETASMMDLIAARGHDVYLVISEAMAARRGRWEMSAPPQANRPIVWTDVAVGDFGAAVDHVLKRRGVARINLRAGRGGRRSPANTPASITTR